MSHTEITTVGTLYLGGQTHGFRPGSTVAIPAAHAEDLAKVKHVEPPASAQPEPVSPETTPASAEGRPAEPTA